MLFNIQPDASEKPAGRIRRQNEALILKAAETEFASSGFKGASIGNIARRAGLPKANIHYYFKNKLGLYIALLSNITNLWDSTFSNITGEDDPKKVLTAYIRQKIEFSRQHPTASRIFAGEVISGAPNIRAYFQNDYQSWFDGRAAVLREWTAQGKMDAVSPEHLIFMIWSCTQHYADFAVQAAAALGKEALTDADYDQAAETLIQIILKGCGIK
ncbi:MAG: TetR family transcriptional regulator C-terminal domain-containing protein [Pontibacterium sp.]